MSRKNGSDTLISWLHRMAATTTFQHVKTTILTESYSNSGLASQPGGPSGGEADADSGGIGPGYAVEWASPGVARRGAGRP
jgi:hypothetical protein